MIVWVAGRVVHQTMVEGIVHSFWELIGVFSSEDKAVAACSDEKDFVGPINLDEASKRDDYSWPGCYYPLLKR